MGCEEYISTATQRLQETINKIKGWADTWALTLNRSKTVATLFLLSNQKETVSLQLDGEKIEISDKTDMEASSEDSGEQKHQKTLPHEETGWNKVGSQFENSTSRVHRQC